MKRLMLALFLVAIPLGLHAQQLSWGPLEGMLGFDEALKLCSSKSMRLPTRAELLGEFKTGANKSWDQSHYGYYWSATMRSSGAPFYVHMDIGVSGVSADGAAFTRCVK